MKIYRELSTCHREIAMRIKIVEINMIQPRNKEAQMAFMKKKKEIKSWLISRSKSMYLNLTIKTLIILMSKNYTRKIHNYSLLIQLLCIILVLI